MSQDNFYIKLVVLLSVFLLTGATKINQEIKNYVASENIVSKASSNDLDNEVNKEIEIIFELQDVTIKEDEKYQISDFMKEEDIKSLDNIKYNFKEDAMGNYNEPGKYEIVIVFENKYGTKLEKNANLIIEKKVIKVDKTPTTNYVPKTNSAPKTDIVSQILSNNKHLGSRGRLFFSSLYSVALYEPTTSEEAQRIVNNTDSASFIPRGNYNIIADHSYQGFDIIKTQNVGNIIYIKKANNVLEKYRVREKTNGKNTGYDLVTNDNRSISNDVNCSLVLYTCNDSAGVSVTILILDRI